jgi:hypothetical protein
VSRKSEAARTIEELEHNFESVILSAEPNDDVEQARIETSRLLRPFDEEVRALGIRQVRGSATPMRLPHDERSFFLYLPVLVKWTKILDEPLGKRWLVREMWDDSARKHPDSAEYADVLLDEYDRHPPPHDQEMTTNYLWTTGQVINVMARPRHVQRLANLLGRPAYGFALDGLCKATRRWKSDDVDDALIALLSVDDVRRDAAAALARRHVMRAVPALELCRGQGDRAERRAVERALRKLTERSEARVRRV